MSRYSTTSISLAMRPWPGMTRVPPIVLNSGMAMSTMRLSASITPCSVPPRAGVDHRIAVQHEHVAGGHDVRLAEEDDQVAVGVGGGLVNHLDRLAGDEERLLRGRERVGRQHRRRHRRRSVARIGHARERVLVRVDARALTEDRVDGAFGRLGERLVAADVIRIAAGVDDVANRRLARACGSPPGPCRDIAASLVSTTITASGPTCTVTLLPAPASM